MSLMEHFILTPLKLIPEHMGQKKCSWPWLWGFIQDGVEVGMEAFAMGSVNLVVAGTVKIVARKVTSEPNSLQDKLAAFHRGDGDGASYFNGEITGPAVFYIPAGWLVARLPLNVPSPYGIRISVMPTYASVQDIVTLKSAAELNPKEEQRKEEEMKSLTDIIVNVANEYKDTHSEESKLPPPFTRP